MTTFSINCNVDCFEELQKIANEVRGKKDIVILFEKNNYICNSENSLNDYNALMSGELNYDTHWGRFDIGYNKGVLFEDVENLLIDGNGSIFCMQGLIAPFTFINCRNVSLKNFNVDWERTLFTPCHIRNVEGNKITIEPFEDYQLNGGEPIWAIMEYDVRLQRFGTPWEFRVKDTLHKLSNNKFEFCSDTQDGELTVGNDIVVRHVGNYRPVFHLYGGSDFTFKDITLFAGVGMGLVAHLTENVTLRNFNVKPFGNRMMSTNTDATHFISCSGIIDVENCYFEGMGDDAINVHGFYNSITNIIDDYTVEVTILNPNGTQDLIFDAPGNGNIVEFSKHDVLYPFEENIAKTVEISQMSWSAKITFEKPLSKEVKVGDLLTDATRVPALRFVNCHINAIRARAALIQTRNVLLEHCLIENCTGTAIHIDTATGWYESIGTKDVIIRNNIIRNCGYGDATYCETEGIAITTECPENKIGVHRDITIEDNRIECNGKNGIFVSSTDGIVIKRNTITGARAAIQIETSDNITIKDNYTSGEIKIQNNSFGYEEVGI